MEFSFLVDLDNDGKARELLPQFGDTKAPTAWYEAAGGGFQKHIVSARSYGHGIGAGDVNGDGRNDIITPQGWLEAPADPRNGDWKMHPEFTLGQTSFIFVIDLNEDGLPDLLTSNAHDYGIFWMEQRRDHTWIKHTIDESWSQPHALTLVDLNGDGRKELLTGKRFMAHDGHDPGGASRWAFTGTSTTNPKTERAWCGRATSSNTDRAPAAVCRFRWPTSTAMATWTSPWAARAACFYSRT